MNDDDLTSFSDNFADWVKEEEQKEPRVPENRIQLECKFEARLAEVKKEAQEIWASVQSSPLHSEFTGKPANTTINENGDPAGSGSPSSSPESGEGRVPVNRTINIIDTCCQVGKLKKISKWGVTITNECPYYMINKRLANSCDKLNANERHCVGLLNFLMKAIGHTFVSDQQLAHWLGVEPKSAARILRKLLAKGIIEEINRVVKYEGKEKITEHRLVVNEPWRDPPESTGTRKRKPRA